jgi:hypothetical protein
MTQKDNILQELNELQSSLVNIDVQNVYMVPAGYFDNLVMQVLNRIKALDTENAAEELSYLSPLLNSISKKMPYAVPADFFNKREEKIMQIMQKDNEEQTAAEELETLSPLLKSLKKEMPYSVPQGYFEGLNSPVNIEEARPAAKVISITKQKWFRYAAAAMIIGFIAIGGFVFLNKKENIDPKTQSSEWVKINTTKISIDDINNFVQLADEGVSQDVAIVDTKNELKDRNDIEELTKNISDKEIEDFLVDAQVSEPDNTSELTN